jgi:hypothetical protein
VRKSKLGSVSRSFAVSHTRSIPIVRVLCYGTCEDRRSLARSRDETRLLGPCLWYKTFLPCKFAMKAQDGRPVHTAYPHTRWKTTRILESYIIIIHEAASQLKCFLGLHRGPDIFLRMRQEVVAADHVWYQVLASYVLGYDSYRVQRCLLRMQSEGSGRWYACF